MVDRAIVNAAMRLKLSDDTQVIEEGALVFGCIDDQPLFAVNTLKSLKGR